MNQKSVIIVIIVVVIALMLLSGRLFNRTSSDGHAGVSGEVKGKPAPDFELKDLSGKLVKLSDYRGKAVLLNFWATWCPPCKSEMPWFVDLQQRYGADGLVVLGVAMDDAGHDAIAKFAAEMKLNYAVLIGTDKVSELYGNVQFLPTTFYIDRNGNITERVFGIISHKDAEDRVKEVLASHVSAKPAVPSSQALPSTAPDQSVATEPPMSSYPATSPKVN